MYECLVEKMVIICSISGIMSILYEDCSTFSCASLNLASMDFIFGSSTRSLQICALSSQSFMHSSSTLLMLATNVIIVLSLPSLTSSDVPGVLRNYRSSISDQKPLMNFSIFNTFSSIVSSTTIMNFAISLYNF
jgi:hypothetical protein